MAQTNKATKNIDTALTEANIYPEESTRINKKEEKEFWELRRKMFRERTPEQKLFSRLMQLKFQMEDYLNDDYYDKDVNFGYFLKEYISSLGRKHKEFAEDIDIKPAELSQLINNHRNPNTEILIRLELHSNNNIPAVMWYKLLEKYKAHELMTDAAIRKTESKHVKRRIEFSM